MRATRCSSLLVLIPVALTALAGVAQAGTVAFEAAVAPREIKACIFNAGGNANPAVLLGLARAPIRPVGWSFRNPLAPPDLAATWPYLDRATLNMGVPPGAARPYPYWEVTATESETGPLVGMDLIYMTTPINLTAKMDAGLIRAVENGALLWIDEAGGAVTRLQPPRSTPGAVPFTFAAAGAVDHQRPADPVCDLFTTPFKLEDWEINNIGLRTTQITWPNTGSATDVEFQRMIHLVNAGGTDIGFSAMVASYGNGTILVTAGNVGSLIGGWVNGLAPDPTTQLPAIKFAYNAIAWAGMMRQTGPAGGRAASPLAKAALSKEWQIPLPSRRAYEPGGATLAFGPVPGSPLYFDGRIYALTTRDTSAGGDPRLVCVDPRPAQDIDGDGNPDDGLNDFANGRDWDVLWFHEFDAAVTGRSSSPVGAVLWQDANTDGVRDPGETRPVVLCTTTRRNVSSGDDGTVWCFDAETGATVWSFTVPPYEIAGGEAAVCDLSSPVVNNGWVYFLASEYDANLAGAVPADNTYGRAWCIDLATGGDLDATPTTGGAQWVYPDSNVRRVSPATVVEPQRALPCMNDPAWVAAVGAGGGAEIPAVPTASPVITSGATLDDDTIVDALMTFGTQVTHVWNGTTIVIDGWAAQPSPRPADRAGGSEFALVPTPLGGSDGTGGLDMRLNRNWWCVRLGAAHAGYTTGRRLGDGDTPTIALAAPRDPANAQVHFNSVAAAGNGAREFLALWSAQAGADPVALQQGCEVQLRFTGSTQWETYYLPGSVHWSRQFGPNEVRVGAGVARGDSLFCPTIAPVTWNYPPVTPVAPSTTPTGLIHVLQRESGVVKSRLDPRVALPTPLQSVIASPTEVGTRNAQSMILAAAGADDGTLIAAVSQWPVGGGGSLARRTAILGLRESANLQIHLGQDAGLSDSVGVQPGANSVALYMFDCFDIAAKGAATLIPPESYEVDAASRIVRIPGQLADDVGVSATAGPDPIAGKAVLVDWLGTDNVTRANELHVFPPAHVFSYVPGFIRLNHYPVDRSTVRVYLETLTGLTPVKFDADGGVLLSEPGEPTSTWDYGNGNRPLLPNGWLDMRNAFADVNNNDTFDAGSDWYLLPGTEVVFDYTGFYEPAADVANPTAYGGRRGFIPIPNSDLGMRAERHQLPVMFGSSVSTPTVAGHTILVATQGVDGQPAANPANPTQRRYLYQSHWTGSFMAPVGGLTTSDTLLALNWNAQTNEVWGRMVAPAQDTSAAASVPVTTGSPAVAGAGVIVGTRNMTAPSATAPNTGSVGYLKLERTLIAAGSRVIECVGAEPVRTLTGSRDMGGGSPRPFGHIAKVAKLASDTLLVVDSGNNEVLELDNLGRRVASLGAAAGLERPTDAWRYYTTQDGVRWAHTVIADAGNKRILEDVAKPASATDPTLTHEQYVVSPEAVPTSKPGQFLQLEYQKAQPLLDPETGDLWGYLACAANWGGPLIVEPPRFDASGRYYPPRVNPPANTSYEILGAWVGRPPFNPTTMAFDSSKLPTLMGGTYSPRYWAAWGFLYNLAFDNIRQIEFGRRGNRQSADSTGSQSRVWVVASNYKPNPNDKTTWTGPGVFEFDMAYDKQSLSFSFTRTDYINSGQESFTLPGGVNTFHKAFFPTSAKRLPGGDYLISNNAGAIDHLTVDNTDMQGWGRVLTSEVFRVSATDKSVWGRSMIPDPARPQWPEPLNLISYAERF